MAPAVAFVRHVLTVSGYAVRRLLAGHPWAWAGDAPVRTQVWEFERNKGPDLHAPFRSEDAQEDSLGEDRPSESPAVLKANTLLENIRRSPMVRGGLHEHQRILRSKILATIEGQNVPRRLAARIALQLVRKFSPRDLGEENVWQALGQLLIRDIAQLRKKLHLTDRQIIVALPKLSADQVEHLFEELSALDAQIGRTIAQAALDGADPLAMGRRYGEAFKDSLEQLRLDNPEIARTLAGAAFKNRRPLAEILSYLERFQQLLKDFKGDLPIVRTVARVAFRAASPLRRARQFIRDYQAIVAELTSKGLEPGIARTLGGIAATGAEPLRTAYKLLDNFKSVAEFAQKSHPSVARSVALAACRAADPLAAATTYIANYDRIVQVVSQTDPHLAHEVAAQAFRTHDPLTWAQRYLKQLKTERSA